MIRIPVLRRGSTLSGSPSVPRGNVAKNCVVGLGIVVVLAMAILYMVLRGSPPITRSEMVQATNDGDRIINAVLRYRDERRTIPGRLEDVVPQYLPEAPDSPLGKWSLAPASPGRPVNDEFAVILTFDLNLRRFRTGYRRVVCYVEIPKRAAWIADPIDERMDSDSLRLRNAAVRWTK